MRERKEKAHDRSREPREEETSSLSYCNTALDTMQ